MPPKHGARPFPPAPMEVPASGSSPAPEVGGAPQPMRPASRSQNRAAKRATSGVQAKRVRGNVRGRPSRGYNPAIIGLAIAAVVVAAGVFLLGNPFGNPTPSESPGGSAAAYGDGTCPTSQPAALATDQLRDVTIDTDLGTIVIRVQASLAPIAAGNFVALAQCQFYDGTVFHRTASLQDGTPFVIQGGDPEGTGGGGPGYTIADEPVTTSYHRGTVAMARTSAPNSEGSQFFIVLDDKDGSVLSATNTYAIFGEVISGMDVADAIFQASAGQEQPENPIVMNSVTVSTPSPSASPAGSAGASPAASTAPSPAASTGTSPGASPEQSQP